MSNRNLKFLVAIMAGFLLMSGTLQADMISTNLELYSPMDDATYSTSTGTGTVPDSTGTYSGALNGTTAASPLHSDSERGQVVDFSGAVDGSNKVAEYINYGDVLDVTDDYTIAFWFKVDDLNHNGLQFVVGKGNLASVTIGWSCFIKSDGTFAFRAYDSSNEVLGVRTDTGVIQEDKWYHVALVFDYDYDGNGTGLMTGYLDGVSSDTWGTVWPDSTYKNTFTSSANFNSTQDLIVGSRSDYSSTYSFDGKVDDFAVWSAALSGEEVAASMVPEPSAIVLLLAGLAGLVMVRRRK